MQTNLFRITGYIGPSGRRRRCRPTVPYTPTYNNLGVKHLRTSELVLPDLLAAR
jgi:hypothetical protein